MKKNYISDEQIPIMQIRVTCVTPSAKNQWTSWIWEVNFKNLLDCTFAINLASKCILLITPELERETKIPKFGNIRRTKFVASGNLRRRSKRRIRVNPFNCEEFPIDKSLYNSVPTTKVYRKESRWEFTAVSPALRWRKFADRMGRKITMLRSKEKFKCYCSSVKTSFFAFYK